MSNVSSNAEADAYWELVHCHVCYHPFIDPGNPQAPPSIPFWLTDCGHVLCNNHLKPDQSCAACGKSDIALMPLQRDLPEPMSQFFRSIPQTLERLCTVAYSQQTSTLKLVRYYRAKCLQYKRVVDKMKGSMAELQHMKDSLAKLQEENRRLRGGERGSFVPNGFSERPGKRKRGEDGNRSSSSHGSALVHPNAPDRLTLPADSINQPPIHSTGSSEVRNVGPSRPATVSLYQEYSYQPHSRPTERSHPPSYSEAIQQPNQPVPAIQPSYGRMPPPPPPLKAMPQQGHNRERMVPDMRNTMQMNWSANQSPSYTPVNPPPIRPMTTVNTGYGQRPAQMHQPGFVGDRPAMTRMQPVQGYPQSHRAPTRAGPGVQAAAPQPIVVNNSRRFQPQAIQNPAHSSVPSDAQRQQFGKFRPASIQPRGNYSQRFVPNAN